MITLPPEFGQFSKLTVLDLSHNPFGSLPPEIAAQAAQLLARPDKAAPAWKAFERALALTRQTPERLLLALGAFDSPRSLHVARFGEREGEDR